VEIVGIRVDPVRYVKERGEVAVPLCRERRGSRRGCMVRGGSRYG
jgi:hypothetical protein